MKKITMLIILFFLGSLTAQAVPGLLPLPDGLSAAQIGTRAKDQKMVLGKNTIVSDLSGRLWGLSSGNLVYEYKTDSKSVLDTGLIAERLIKDEKANVYAYQQDSAKKQIILYRLSGSEKPVLYKVSNLPLFFPTSSMNMIFIRENLFCSIDYDKKSETEGILKLHSYNMDTGAQWKKVEMPNERLNHSFYGYDLSGDLIAYISWNKTSKNEWSKDLFVYDYINNLFVLQVVATTVTIWNPTIVSISSQYLIYGEGNQAIRYKIGKNNKFSAMEKYSFLDAQFSSINISGDTVFLYHTSEAEELISAWDMKKKKTTRIYASSFGPEMLKSTSSIAWYEGSLLISSRSAIMEYKDNAFLRLFFQYPSSVYSTSMTSLTNGSLLQTGNNPALTFIQIAKKPAVTTKIINNVSFLYDNYACADGTVLIRNRGSNSSQIYRYYTDSGKSIILVDGPVENLTSNEIMELPDTNFIANTDKTLRIYTADGALLREVSIASSIIGNDGIRDMMYVKNLNLIYILTYSNLIVLDPVSFKTIFLHKLSDKIGFMDMTTDDDGNPYLLGYDDYCIFISGFDDFIRSKK